MDEMDRLSDGDLIDRCVKGDERAWMVFHDRHDETLRTIIWYRVGEERYDRYLVEDIAQMVWLSLLRNSYEGLRRYQQERGYFNTYLREVARQMIELHRRANGRRL